MISIRYLQKGNETKTRTRHKETFDICNDITLQTISQEHINIQNILEVHEILVIFPNLDENELGTIGSDLPDLESELAL